MKYYAPVPTYSKTCKYCSSNFQSINPSTKTCDVCKEASPMKTCKECNTNTFRSLSITTGLCKQCTINISHKLYEGKSKTSHCECAVCGFKGIDLANHVKFEHRLSSEEYIDTYKRELIAEDKKDKYKGDKNPGFNHGGKLSPFSKKFVAYEGLSDDEIKDKTESLVDTSISNRILRNNSTTSLSYYTSRGHSEAEGKLLLAKRQTTFNLEKCVDRYGPIEGFAHWQERQDRWQAAFDEYTSEQIEALNKSKSWNNGVGIFGKPDIDYPDGIFYVLQLKNGFIKIGISQNPVEGRYSLKTLDGCKVLFTIPNKVNDCYKLEQIVKLKLQDFAINKEEIQEGFGWTETFKGVASEDILSIIESINNIEEEYSKHYR